MDLDWIVTTENGTVLRVEYLVALEGPSPITGREEDSQEFTNYFYFFPLELFGLPHLEQEVLDFYRNTPSRLPVNLSQGASEVLKAGDSYYHHTGNYFLSNKDDSIRITVHKFAKVNLGFFQGVAVRRLLDIVQDEDLSRGDRLIIKNIALDNFYRCLELALDPQRKYSFTFCFSLDWNQAALSQLEEYGFKVRSKKIVSFG
ncbi:MAG: hypothetical protein V2A62_02385 [Candidatus Woesearchaeota archaeon]